jgi:hypothetical protein
MIGLRAKWYQITRRHNHFKESRCFMSSQNRGFVGMAIVLGVLTVMVFVNAGALNPPSGPVQPTMRTLDEVYDAASQRCPLCPWSYKYLESSAQTEAVPGAGILHGIWLYGFSQNNSSVVVSNGPSSDNDVIGKFDAYTTIAGTGWSLFMPPQFISLDVPFQNGLYVSAPNTKVTLLYRSSP